MLPSPTNHLRMTSYGTHLTGRRLSSQFLLWLTHPQSPLSTTFPHLLCSLVWVIRWADTSTTTHTYVCFADNVSWNLTSMANLSRYPIGATLCTETTLSMMPLFHRPTRPALEWMRRVVYAMSTSRPYIRSSPKVPGSYHIPWTCCPSFVETGSLLLLRRQIATWQGR